jgi:hypothetical protein
MGDINQVDDLRMERKQKAPVFAEFEDKRLEEE